MKFTRIDGSEHEQLKITTSIVQQIFINYINTLFQHKHLQLNFVVKLT